MQQLSPLSSDSKTNWSWTKIQLFNGKCIGQHICRICLLGQSSPKGSINLARVSEWISTWCQCVWSSNERLSSWQDGLHSSCHWIACNGFALTQLFQRPFNHTIYFLERFCSHNMLVNLLQPAAPHHQQTLKTLHHVLSPTAYHKTRSSTVG
jgi:hypothetical protein